MPGAILESTGEGELQPLLAGDGVPVFRSLPQIQTELWMVLTEEHVALFAEPSADPRGRDIAWHAPSPGAVARLQDLAAPVRVAVEARLAELVREIAEHAASLQRSASDVQRLVGNKMALALEIPDEQHIFAVAGRPVIAAWGHVPPGLALPRHVLTELARRIEQEEAAPAPLPTGAAERHLEVPADANAIEQLGEAAAAPVAPSSEPPKSSEEAGGISPRDDVASAADEQLGLPVGEETDEAQRAGEAEAAAPPASDREKPTPSVSRRQLDELQKLEAELEQLRQAEAARRRAEADAAQQGQAASSIGSDPVGHPFEKEIAAPPAANPIEFGVSHPWGAARGTPFVVHAWVFPPDQRREAERRAMAPQGEESGLRSGGAAVLAGGTELAVRLELAGCDAQPPTQALTWSGSLATVAFAVTAVGEVPGGRLAGTVTFHANGIRIAQLPVLLSLGNAPLEQTRFLASAGVRSAFACYARRDRARVLARVQGMEKLGVNVLVDVRPLKPKDDYPAHLLAQIERADVLYLFWSRRAKASPWVAREWQHALARRGRAFIDPVPLADPRKVPLPPELTADNHADDWTLAYLAYEKSLSRWRRLGLWLASR